MKLNGVGILFLALISFQGMSQVTKKDTLPSSAETPSNSSSLSGQTKMRVNVMAGSEFWTAPGYGSGFGTFLTAGITYPVGKKFSLGGGIGVINSTLTGVHNTSTESFGQPNLTNTLVYVTGEYLLSQHLTVSGTLFKEFNILNASPEYRQFQRNTPQGAYMKVKYKVNDFMQIEAGFGYSHGVNPYYNSYLGSPFYNRPFLFGNP